MSQNDFFVVAYKILEYFYECMKQGKKPKFTDYNNTSELLEDIPEDYWNYVMKLLIDNEFIENAWVIKKAGPQSYDIKVSRDTGITLKGIEFLEENSTISKAKDLFGKAVEILVNAIVSKLP